MDEVIKKLQVEAHRLIDERDWHGARALLEAMDIVSGQNVTINHPPQVPRQEAVQEELPKTDNTSFDDARMAKFENQPANKQ